MWDALRLTAHLLSSLILSFLPLFDSRHPFISLLALRVNVCWAVLWNILKLCFKYEDASRGERWIFTELCGRALKKFLLFKKVKGFFSEQRYPHGVLDNVLMRWRYLHRKLDNVIFFYNYYALVCPNDQSPRRHMHRYLIEKHSVFSKWRRS